jgi:hypothetical protein
LTLLQAYCNVHAEADTNLQQAIWSLTKARRASRSFAALPSTSTEMTAASVRHDLNARTVLVEVDKDSIGVTSCFRTFDPKIPLKQCDDGILQHDDDATGLMVDAGLRQRKGKTPESSSSRNKTNSSLVMDSLNTEKVVSAEEEALMILGGTLPPRDLRVAQERAHKCLNEYIQAATLVAALQQRLRASKSP